MKHNGSLITKLKKTYLLLIISVFSLTIQAQTTYYISNSQGNDSNIGTTESTAWKSLDKLNSSWNLVQPGDSVLLKRGDSWSPSSVSNLGVIELPNNKSGTAGNYIVIGAYGSGAKPFINSTNITNYHNIIRTGSTAYLIIQDINFKTIRSVIIRPQDNWDVGVHHLKFLRCDFDFGFVQGVGGQGHFEIYNPYTPQNPQPNITAPQHHIEIGYCTFTNTGGEDCLQIERPSVITGNDPNWKDHNGTDVNHWIHNNIFKMVREEAMDIGGGNNHLIEYNFVSGTGANGMKFHSQVREFTNSTIRGNVMVHAGMGDLLQDTGKKMSGGAAIVFQNVSNCAIYNNVAYSRWSFWYGDRDRTGTLGYFGTFENNTIYNNISYGCVLIEGVVNNVINNIGLTNTFSNNTYYGPDDSGDWEPNKVIRINGDYITMGTFSSSWVEGTGNGGTNENNSKPLFENDYWTTPYVYGDFSLGASSPMIDAGVNINGYTIDIEGNPVPQGSSTDRGAYEFNGVDLTAPRLISAEILNLNTVDVQFSESIKKSSAENVNNYSINNGITINSAVLSSSNKKVTLSTSSHSNGSYTVTAENIEDLSGNVIATNNNAQYSFSPDLISPILHSVEVLDNTSLRIKFSEPINKTSAEEIQNYNIDNDVEVLTAVLSSTDEVSLTTSEHNPGNYTIIVSNIEDLAGNIIDLNFNRLNYTIIEYADLLLLSTYDFFKGEDPTIVYDRSSNGEPLNLAIEDITCVQWLKPNGLAVISPTKIISQDLPTKIVDACVLSGEISIEVWLKPIKLKQSGPARIVSLSANSFGRNFTLGQSTTDGLYDIYDVRLRTTESNSNGIPSVSTEPGSVTKSLTHLVYTRNSEGFTKIYLNSNEIISDSLGGDFSNWDDSFPLILANEATNDRPWLGEFYRLSIYNTMLSQQKVDSLFNYSNITDVKNEKSNTPSDYRLDQNYPNPFNPNTKIRFSIPRRGNVNLKVFNILGEEIVDLVNSELKSGAYSVDFNAEDLPSGIYFYQLIT